MNWLEYFRHNRDYRMKIPWERGIEIPADFRKPLIESLQRFQVGESGEGNQLRARARTTRNVSYEATIDLFIQEEQEHARLMACVLQKLNAPLLKKHWSDECFIALRHFFGLHGTLLVLLMPEMIAKCYFQVLREGTSDPVLGTVFEQISRDETGHLAFHADYLNQACSGLSFRRRIFMQVAWRIAFRAVCGVMIFDHRRALQAVGKSPMAFWHDCGLVFDEVAALIFSPAHVLCAPRLASLITLNAPT